MRLGMTVVMLLALLLLAACHPVFQLWGTYANGQEDVSSSGGSGSGVPRLSDGPPSSRPTDLDPNSGLRGSGGSSGGRGTDEPSISLEVLAGVAGLAVVGVSIYQIWRKRNAQPSS